jgi:cell division protein ZapA (FtsZ GTPase activity inhibitor)
MIDKKNKSYKVTICGNSYALITNEPEDHVIKAAQRVDALIQEIVSKSPGVDEKKVAVLVALRLASHNLQLEAEATAQQHIKEQLVDIIDRELRDSC